MKSNIIYLMVAWFLLSLCPIELPAQDNNQITVSSRVVDESGQPITGANVYAENKCIPVNENGEFSLRIKSNSKVIIQADGYQDQEFLGSELQEEIKMLHSSIFYGNNDMVNLPFRQVKKGDVIGAASGYNIDNISSYDNSIWLDGVLSGRSLGMLGSKNIRGLGIGIDVGASLGTNSGSALVIVDGMPRNISGIRLSDIESISVLRDVNSAILYGSAAVNGVILITTKRGKAYKKTADFSVEYGMAFPRSSSMPEFLGSAEYMEYYNQARINDGFLPTYTDETINNYRYGNKYRYPDVDYYSSDYLKSFKNSVDVNAQFSGGDQNVKYLADFGWNSQGSILNFGEGKNARSNNFNVRANIDLRINSWLNTAVDVTGLFYNSTGPRGNFWGNSSTIRPFEFSPLIPISMIDPNNPLLQARKNDIDGKYLIGGNSNYITHGIGDAYAAGISNSIWRTFSFNNRINVNLDMITKGLSFHTNFSFDYFLQYNQVTPKGYSVYEPIWGENDQIIDLKQHGKDSNPGNQNVENRNFRRQMAFYGLLSYDRTFDRDHHITGSLLGYGSAFKDNDGKYNDFQGFKSSHLGIQLGYTYDKKYMIDFSGAMLNSVKLAKKRKIGFSPSVALAWVISREEFMNKPDFLDYLKLKASAGILKSDIPIGDYYYYDERYTTSGSYSWYEEGKSRPGVIASWPSNADLNFMTRKEMNFGLQAHLFNMLGIEANYFHDVYDGLVVRPNSTYPSFYNDFVPYTNFEKDAYRGVELGLSLNKEIGDWEFYAGLNFLYSVSKRLKVNEVYANDYQYRRGYNRSANFGLEAVGLFQSQEDIDKSPFQTFGTVKPGDIKYKDQNGDKIIDSRDEVYLCNWQAPWTEGLELKVRYKNLTLFLIGEGQQGAKAFKESSYYWMDGNDKYSVIARDCWTPETSATASYPRLSSETNNNNFRRSSFWMYDNSFFNLRRVQLNYKIPDKLSDYLFAKDLNISLSATDLFQIAPNLKERSLRIGAEPYYRTFAVTLKAKF